MTIPLWSSQRLRITVQGPKGSTNTTVDKPFARIGAHKSSEVLLPGGGMPLRCFYLHATEAGIYWLRLWDADNENMPKRGWLRRGQRISCGAYTLLAETIDDENQPPAHTGPIPADDDAGPPYPVVSVLARDKLIGKRSLRRRLTVVGRKRPSSLQVTSSYFSSTQCVLIRELGRLWAIDLFSGNGTCLDGDPIDVTEIQPNGKLSVANIELSFSGLGSPEPAENVADTAAFDGVLAELQDGADDEGDSASGDSGDASASTAKLADTGVHEYPSDAESTPAPGIDDPETNDEEDAAATADFDDLLVELSDSTAEVAPDSSNPAESGADVATAVPAADADVEDLADDFLLDAADLELNKEFPADPSPAAADRSAGRTADPGTDQASQSGDVDEAPAEKPPEASVAVSEAESVETKETEDELGPDDFFLQDVETMIDTPAESTTPQDLPGPAQTAENAAGSTSNMPSGTEQTGASPAAEDALPRVAEDNTTEDLDDTALRVQNRLTSLNAPRSRRKLLLKLVGFVLLLILLAAGGVFLLDQLSASGSVFLE